ncbi:MAG: hypothetical protein JO011_06220 [Ktedonobacteraceae bacterium]|nr:hypothetical protein [Ktedonobacteraceae bacterium]
MPTSSALNSRLCNTLQTLFPRSTPISIFLLHISQWERTHSAHQSASSYQRQHYHASLELLEQVMTNVRRVMRADDQVLLQEHAGAIIIFPDVDQQGAYSILDRIYHSICLLQAETLIPPLTLDTTILMSMSTYPQPAPSMEQLLYFTGIPAHRFTLRPAIIPHSWHTSSTPLETPSKDEHIQNTKGQSGFPFMNLPSTLPLRLQHLIPHPLATELRCVPVGRDHHCLTVAMADPANNEQIQRLHAATGLTIFPVSCDPEALSTLLAKTW